jgi:hypothetical protein
VGGAIFSAGGGKSFVTRVHTYMNKNAYTHIYTYTMIPTRMILRMILLEGSQAGEGEGKRKGRRLEEDFLLMLSMS